MFIFNPNKCNPTTLTLLGRSHTSPRTHGLTVRITGHESKLVHTEWIQLCDQVGRGCSGTGKQATTNQVQNLQ